MSDLRFLTHVCNSPLIQDKEFVLSLVQNQTLTPKLLHELFHKCDFEKFDLTDYRTQKILAYIVQHPYSTPRLIDQIDAMFSGSVPFVVLSAITQSMKVPSTILDRKEYIITDSRIAKNVAGNLSSSEGILDELLYHPEPEVVLEAVVNPNTKPDDIRTFLAEASGIHHLIVEYANEILEKTSSITDHLEKDTVDKLKDQVRRVYAF